tara:strand:- start:538 stop:672 length:135 start_codon:yes stop_codon:yes gene_type:complete
MGKGFDSFFFENTGAELLVAWTAAAKRAQHNLMTVASTSYQTGG